MGGSIRHRVDLSNKEQCLSEVQQAMKKTTNRRMFERYQIISLYLKEYSSDQIIEIVGRSRSTIQRYIQAYRQSGLHGLLPHSPPGRPKRLTVEQEQELSQVITHQTPDEVGFLAEKNWHSFLVRDWIEKQFQISYSDRGVRNLLKRLGFSYTKASYTLAKANPEKQETFKQQFQGVKKN